jgi:hypothetical protein
MISVVVGGFDNYCMTSLKGAYHSLLHACWSELLATASNQQRGSGRRRTWSKGVRALVESVYGSMCVQWVTQRQRVTWLH